MSDLENNHGVTPCTSEDRMRLLTVLRQPTENATVTLTLDDGTTVQECAVLNHLTRLARQTVHCPPSAGRERRERRRGGISSTASHRKSTANPALDNIDGRRRVRELLADAFDRAGWMTQEYDELVDADTDEN